MLVFLIDIIFVMRGGHIFQQTIGIPMDTNIDHDDFDLVINSQIQLGLIHSLTYI